MRREDWGKKSIIISKKTDVNQVRRELTIQEQWCRWVEHFNHVLLLLGDVKHLIEDWRKKGGWACRRRRGRVGSGENGRVYGRAKSVTNACYCHVHQIVILNCGQVHQIVTFHGLYCSSNSHLGEMSEPPHSQLVWRNGKDQHPQKTRWLWVSTNGICYETQLTNTKIKMSKTSRLSREVN